MTRQIAALNPGPNSEAYGIHGTDLLIPVLCPDGRTILWFGGDSFRLPHLNPSGGWYSPIMFTSDISDPYRFLSCNKNILQYEHGRGGISTKLPTSAIFIGNTLYLHYMIMGPGGLQDTVGTGFASSPDFGKSWKDHGLKWHGNSYGGLNQMRAMIDGRDGFIYHFCARGLARTSNLWMMRCRPGDILNPDAYEAWGLNGPNRSWAFGREPAMMLQPGTEVGELSVAWVEDRVVLSFFRHSPPSSIEVRVGQGIFTDWTKAPTYTVIRNSPFDGANTLRQLYGGYIVPGSTLRNLRLAVSQWVTSTNDPYRVVVFDETDVSRPPVNNPIAQAITDFLSRFRRP